MQEAVRAGVIAAHRDADAAPDRDLAVADGVRPPETLGDAPRRGERLFHVDVLEQQHELVTGEPREVILRTDLLVETRRGLRRPFAAARGAVR